MRTPLPLTLVLLLSCAAPQVKRSAPPPAELSFAGLRGQHVQVVIVDRGRLFDGQPGVVAATKQAVEQQLTSHGVIADDVPSAELRRLVLSLDPPAATDAYGARSCVQVAGRLEATQAFLPTPESMATRCGGRGPGSGPGDAGAAIFLLVGTAIATANGSRTTAEHRELGEALSAALAEVLSQIDARTR